MNAAGRILYWQSIKDHKAIYALGLFTLLVTSAAEVMVPKFVQWILDLLVHSRTPAWLGNVGATRSVSLDHLIGGLMGAVFMGWCGRVGWRQTMARRTHNAGYELKNRLWNALRHQRLGVFLRFPLGDLMNRATADWNSGRIIHGFTLVLTFDLIFFTLLSVGSMMMIHLPLTLVGLLGFPLLAPFVLRYARKEYDLHMTAQERLSGLSHLISQTIVSVRLQRATGSEAVWQSKLSSAAREYADRRFEVLRTGWRIFPFGTLPTVMTYAVLMTYGIYEIHAGRLSIGAFIAMQSYVLLLQVPLFELAEIFSEWQTGLAGMERIAAIDGLRDTEKRRPGHVPHPAHANVVTLSAIDFTYPNAPLPTLRGLNLTLTAGERLGITGPIGSGKSTLVTLLAGLYQPSHGRYELLGRQADELGREGFTASVGLVPQKTFLFAGTIRRNLELDQAATDAELWDALRVVRLDEEVRAMALGLDSLLGESAVNLSGGQRQRLSLARAVLRPAPLLLLDDCLSAVDAVTEQGILAELAQRFAGRTIVWVAHRASSLRLCDRVLEMADGTFIASAATGGEL